MNKFMLTYDTDKAAAQFQIDAFISGSKYVDSWSFLFPGSYLFKSINSIEEFIQNFAAFFGNARFLIIKISDDTNDVINGKVSPQIWQWMSGMSDEEYYSALETYKKQLT